MKMFGADMIAQEIMKELWQVGVFLILQIGIIVIIYGVVILIPVKFHEMPNTLIAAQSIMSGSLGV
jgi:hypothetical protein